MSHGTSGFTPNTPLKKNKTSYSQKMYHKLGVMSIPHFCIVIKYKKRRRLSSMKTYKEIIRELREDSDLTQTDVANILNIRYNVYQRYELGTSKLPIHHLLKLAEFYNVSTDYILGVTNERREFPKRQRLSS